MSQKTRLTPLQANCLQYLHNNGGTALATSPDAIRVYDALVKKGLAEVIESHRDCKRYRLVEG